MNQTQRILELVKGGSITVEQGMELLKALEGAGADRPSPPEAPRPPRPPQPAWKENVSTAKKVGRPLGSGGGQLSFDQIVQLGMYNIKPEFVQQMREAGLEDLSFDTVVQLGMYGVKPSYVLEIREIAQQMGAPMPSTQKIIELGMYGIKPGYIRDMIQSGVMGLDALSEETTEEKLEAKRAKIHAKRHKLESKREQLEPKRVKLQAKLEKSKGEKEREKLEEMLEEVTDELESLKVDLEDLLEKQLEVELEAEEATVGDPESHGSKSDRRKPQFTSEVLVDPNLPASERKNQLEEQMRDVNAAMGITQEEEDREALLEVKRRIEAELALAEAETQDPEVIFLRAADTPLSVRRANIGTAIANLTAQRSILGDSYSGRALDRVLAQLRTTQSKLDTLEA
jgi:hypothetical protein